ncbi:MAG: acyl carrier protein [Fibrobacter sp.]|nr:acyl carrier protein [Fibrobacter sp.]
MSSNINIQDHIVSFIKSNFLMNSDTISFTNNDSFLEKGIIDSTGILELVSFVQQTFGITVHDEELLPENFDSVNKIVSYVSKKSYSNTN